MFFACCANETQEEPVIEVSATDEKPAETTKEAEPVKEEAPPAKVEEPAVSSRFTITVEKTKELASLGMSLDFADPTLLQVTKLGDGVVPAYNKTAEAGKKLEAGMYIISVNGTSGDASKMLQVFKAEQKFELQVAPKVEFEVTIDKTGKPWGMATSYTKDGEFICIKDVIDGAVADYNSAATDDTKKVKPMDKIVQINGAKGSSLAMMDKLKADTKIALVLVRPAA